MGEDKISEDTSLGLSENIEGALCYSFGFVTGIIFLFLEDENKFVKFHAIQSTIVFLPLFIIYSHNIFPNDWNDYEYDVLANSNTYIICYNNNFLAIYDV